MSPRTAARALAAGRVVLGLGLLVAPTRFSAGWIGPSAAGDPVSRMLVRALGVRDLILGGIALAGGAAAAGAVLAGQLQAEGAGPPAGPPAG